MISRVYKTESKFRCEYLSLQHFKERETGGGGIIVTCLIINAYL